MTLQMKYDEKFEEGRQEGKLEGCILTLDELGYSVSEIAEKLNQKQEKVFEILNSKD